MADNASGSSRSRKQRRSRSNRKKSKKCNSVTLSQPPEPVAAEPTATVPETDSAAAAYMVEFPQPAPTEKKPSAMVKSRSLDDDDQVKITEVSTDEERTASVSESTAIVSEAESDVEWEVVGELAGPKKTSEQQFGKLSVISLPLEEHVTFETSHISPEDERSLRDFLEGLNLVNSPEESAKRIEKTSTETVKVKRAKKRAALAQHFIPFYQNQRYLDVISEEGSDSSDRDNKQSALSMCHIVDNYDDEDDDVFEDVETKMRSKFQSHYAGSNEGAILVGTKLIDHDSSTVKEAMWSTSMTETASGAEVVYLEDSSNSMTPSDLLDLEETTGDLDADDEDDVSIDLDKTCSESFEIDLNSSESSSLIKSDNAVTSSSETASRVSLPTDSDQIKSETAHHPTPPPTPNTPANDSEEPKPSNKKTIDFLHRVLAIVSNNNSNDVLLSLNDDEVENLPPDIKNKLETSAIVGDQTKMIDEIKILQNSIRGTSLETESELNKELKNLCECLNKAGDEYSNQIDSTANTSRSGSASSARSSSRSTSQCTAFYNPLHSSLTNIAAMLREGSFDERSRTEPAPLREICVRALLDMPFGKDVIEELANVSLSLEEMTRRTPSRSQNVPHNKSFHPPHNSKPDTDASSVLLVDSPVVRNANAPTMDAERWIGMPTEENPKLLVYLSPAQKEFIDTTKTFPNEADSLLDLHRKYIERRGYHENHEHAFASAPVNKDVPTFKIKIDTEQNNSAGNNLLKIIQNSATDTINNNNIKMSSNINYNNYVKQFTREIPIHVIKSNESDSDSKVMNANLRYDKYIKQLTREVPIQVERQINKPVNNKIYSAALSDENTSSRLKARHLGEWLNLARNECDRINNTKKEHIREVHNLHSTVNKLVSQRSCDARLTNSLEPTFARGTSPRRHSLPFNLYAQQMQYILDKESEIEREIEKLKEEKSKLENDEQTRQTNDIHAQKCKQFDAAQYQISRKGDIAILTSESDKLIIPSSEKFREEMYNEYMCKVAERQERKHNKVIKIKISSKPDETPSVMSPQYEVKHTCGIEDEFMSKVRERKGKLGIEEDGGEDSAGKAVACEAPAVVVMDGSSMTGASQLPKHLQEFIDYTNTAPDDGEFFVVKIAMSVVWFFVMNFYYFLWNTFRRVLKS